MRKKRLIVPRRRAGGAAARGRRRLCRHRLRDEGRPAGREELSGFVLKPALESELQTSLDEASGAMRAASGAFTLLTLSNGQSVR